MPPTQLTARRAADFSAHVTDVASLCAVGVALDGSILAVVRSEPRELQEVRGGGAIFPKTMLDEPCDYLVLRGGSDAVVTVRGESIPVGYVQPTPDGGFLLVGARAGWRREGAQKNALLVDAQGRPRRRFCVGDGVQDVRVTPGGHLWVSYFDEGIFGNFGWGPSGPTPIGEPGLVSFDLYGGRLDAYDAAAAGTDTVCDAYAINVAADDDLWMYFYTDFPIVRRHAGRYQVWTTGVAGARALAVRGDRALLYGDYDKPDRVRLLELGPGRAARRGPTATVVDEAGAALTEVLPLGVGERLYLVRGAQVYVVEAW